MVRTLAYRTFRLRQRLRAPDALNPAGGPRVDQCSNDPDNNKDKDRKCDERGTDDQVVSWDFYTHPLNDKGKKAGLVGWSDKEDVFEVAGEEPVVLSELDDRRFIFDERVIEICERSDSAIDALFSVTRGRYDWTGTMESVQHLIEVRDAALEPLQRGGLLGRDLPREGVRLGA